MLFTSGYSLGFAKHVSTVPVCIVQSTNLLSLVVIFAQPEEWELVLDVDIEF